jgi:MFS family permease
VIVSLAGATRYLATRPIATVTLVGAVVVAFCDGLRSLMPVYGRDVLGVDRAATDYLIVPGAIGFLVGAVAGPWLMDRHGEHPHVAVALSAIAIGAVLCGLGDQRAPIVAPVSPLRLLERFGITLRAGILAAGLFAIPLSFGSTAVPSVGESTTSRELGRPRGGPAFRKRERDAWGD